MFALRCALLSLAGQGLALSIPRHATVVDRAVAAGETYDFVIAGGGISGLTVADRLTEDPSIKVLVLEAGPLDKGDNSVLIPGAFNPAPYLWLDLLSTPQEALNNGVYLAAAGKVVGGGSAVNAMIFTRGDKRDYTAWSLLGNSGWSWDDLFPYFLKSENFTAPDAAFAAEKNITWTDSVHGHDGPVQITYPNYYFPGNAYWRAAALEAGIPLEQDPNDGDVRGLFALPFVEDARTRTRSYARINHYERVKAERPNYHLLPSTSVARVLFDSSKRATGVEYLPTAGGNRTTVYASKEVLVAAGGVHTPQLLQLSGVGPKALLDSFGINVVADLPGVGQNFQDQPTIPTTYNFTNNVSPNWGSLVDNATYDAEQFALYNETKTGPYTLLRTISGQFATLAIGDVTTALERAKIIAKAVFRNPLGYLDKDTPSTVAAGYLAQRAIQLAQLADASAAQGGLHWSTTGTATVYAFKPLSRGTIKIQSTNPLTIPLVDFRVATDPTDMDVYVSLFRKLRAVMTAKSFKTLGPIETTPFAGTQSDDQIAAAVKTNLDPTNGHECCTAAMLPRILGGVVDSQNRVYGVQGLRVIDISFWPLPVTGAPTATVYATSEKIAAQIKTDYGLN